MSSSTPKSGWTTPPAHKDSSDTLVFWSMPAGPKRQGSANFYQRVPLNNLLQDAPNLIYRNIDHDGLQNRKRIAGELKPLKADKFQEDMSEIDAKIAASEARTDTKFAEMMGELRLINQRIDHIEKTTHGMKSTIIGTGIGIVAIVIAVMAYGSQWFSNGMASGTIADKATQSAIHSLRPDIEELQKSRVRQEQQYELILKAIQSQTDSKPQ